MVDPIVRGTTHAKHPFVAKAIVSFATPDGAKQS